MTKMSGAVISVGEGIKRTALFFAGFFIVVALVQNFYLEQQFKGYVASLLRTWSQNVVVSLERAGGEWNLTSYQSAAPLAPHYYVINKYFIDAEGGVTPSGLLPQITIPQELLKEGIQKYSNGAGAWQILTKQLKDGWLIVGMTITPPGSSNGEIDKILTIDAARFGDTASSARLVPVEKTNAAVNYAIIDGNNELVSAFGQLPIQTNVTPLLLRFPNNQHFVISDLRLAGGRQYFVSYQKIGDPTQDGGLVIIPQDVDMMNTILSRIRLITIALAILSFIIFAMQTFYSSRKAEKEREKIKGNFQSYFSPQIMQKILDNPTEITQDVERKTVTVLFSDIRSFTKLAEELRAKDLVMFLQEYFSVMAEEVFKTNGVLDKFIGDAVMAFWGAPGEQPDHANRAVETAFNMMNRLHEINPVWKEKGWPQINVGIGINTGVVTVGNIGSNKRYDYTVIGDAVNVASRLESLNKEYGSNIIISGSTFQELTNSIETEAIGHVSVKGREGAVKIYRVKWF